MTMKILKISLALLFIFLTYTAHSQQFIEKYCSVTIKYNNKGNELLLDTGKVADLFSFRIKKITTDLKRVKECSTIIDLLNYMSSIGWSVINPNPSRPNDYTLTDTFYFKRLFKKEDLNPIENN